ncbi:TPA: hypothetical protein VDU83_002499 [Pseudomonas aeruginosa]|nr:hypothetical protein [Pseudomonas aeruginosa]
MSTRNPYDLEETLLRLRAYLSKKGGHYRDGLELLEKAVSRSKENAVYAAEMEETLLRGSTIELRELLSPFGDYFGPPRSEFPFYPHTDGVNAIDTAMHHIKLGIDQEEDDN